MGKRSNAAGSGNKMYFLFAAIIGAIVVLAILSMPSQPVEDGEGTTSVTSNDPPSLIVSSQAPAATAPITSSPRNIARSATTEDSAMVSASPLKDGQQEEGGAKTSGHEVSQTILEKAFHSEGSNPACSVKNISPVKGKLWYSGPRQKIWKENGMNMKCFLGQHYEDLFLFQKYFANVKGGFFVEIGALDGFSYSATWFFEKHLQWKGLLIEASPLNHYLYRQKTKALGRNARTVPYVRAAACSEERNLTYIAQQGTAAGILEFMPEQEKERILGSKAGCSEVPGYDVNNPSPLPLKGCSKIPIQCVRLADEFRRRSVTHVDIFILDVQGAELSVLNSLDLEETPVHFFVVESEGAEPEKDARVRCFLRKHHFVPIGKLEVNEIWMNVKFNPNKYRSEYSEGTPDSWKHCFANAGTLQRWLVAPEWESQFGEYEERNSPETALIPQEELCEAKHTSQRKTHLYYSGPSQIKMKTSGGGGGGNGAGTYCFKGQHYEDLYMFQHHLAHVRGGFFIELGALDGVSYSATWFFEKILGWNGLLIEASPMNWIQYKAKMKKQGSSLARRVPYVKAAVCNEDKGLTYIAQEGTAAGILEFMPEQEKKRILKNGCKKVDDFDPENPNLNSGGCTQIPIKCVKLAQELQSRNVSHIDLFILDVQGAELAVLQSMDLSAVPVWYFVVELEGAEPEKDAAVRCLLRKNGYDSIGRLEVNEVWVKRDFDPAKYKVEYKAPNPHAWRKCFSKGEGNDWIHAPQLPWDKVLSEELD